MREIVSPLDGIRSPFGSSVSPLAIYAVLGIRPELVLDFDDEKYFANSTSTTFSDAITHSASSNATTVDSDGLLKWRSHNLLDVSTDLNGAGWSFSNATLSGGALDADGGTDAFTATAETLGSFLEIRKSFTGVVGVRTTQSIRLKAGGITEVVVRFRDASSISNRADVAVNLDAGELGTPNVYGTYSDVEATIDVLGGGWYEIKLSAVVGASAFLRFDITVSSASVVGTGDFFLYYPHVYRSDLGGMVNNPDRGDSYVPTTSSAVYLPRRGHHIYNGTSWVNEGLLHESEQRVNLLHTTDALVTQSLTVTAVPHTLHFTGTGTVTLSGASTAGPLVGTGTGENNRVSLTFTPTAASLTLTVTGTVTNAQLEVGSTPSSYIPNLAASGSATRAAETLTIPSAKLPWSSDAVSIQMQGKMTYADEDAAFEVILLRWSESSDNQILQYISTTGGDTGQPFFWQEAGTVVDIVGGSPTAYSPGINVPFNIASRHGSTFINGAVDGTALTADLTPTALPDLSATDLNLGFDYMGCIKLLRIWSADLGDAGIAQASTS